MHHALYRKWRPKDFSDVVGEDHITKILQYEVSESKLNHAYLFCGSRGIGKTTCAKILAKAVNCRNCVNGNPCNNCDICKSIDLGNSLDVIEMDAASNTGVDYIRDIKDEIIFTPSSLSKRVYIIDEVHMLSDSAFNALLKTLEEPPENVIFILATTEPHKIPATIISRCQKFDFKRITSDVIINRLQFIAKEESIDLTYDGAFLIARLAQGGMRDAISLLELCAADGESITAERVGEIAGVVGRERLINVVGAIVNHNAKIIFDEISFLYSSSIDLMVFVNELYQFYRDMMVQRIFNSDKYEDFPRTVLDVSEAEFADIVRLASGFKYSTLVYHSKVIEEACIAISRGADKRSTVEMALVKLCYPVLGDSNESLAARIDEVENKINKIIISGVKKVEQSDNSVKAGHDKKNTEKQVKMTDAGSLKELIPLNNWLEICDVYKTSNPSATAFLESSKAFVRGDTLVLKTDKPLISSFISKSSVSEEIINTVNSFGNNINSIELIVENFDSEQKDIFEDF